MKKGKASVIKRILIVMLCVIIFIIAAGIIVYNVFLKPEVEKVLTAVDEVILSGELFDEIDPYITEELLEQLEISVGDGIGEEHEIPTNDADNADNADNPDNPDEGNSDIEDTPPTKGETKNPDTYMSKYDYIRANVRAEDFAKGLEFASRIDIQYILGIIEGGLTIPEKVELKKYLNERFTSTEQAEGLSLYIKYSHLFKK